MRSVNKQKTRRNCIVCVNNLTTTHSKWCLTWIFLMKLSVEMSLFCGIDRWSTSVVIFEKSNIQHSYFRFYICCDRCQDWFHGRCVGILQSEADNIDEYICPRCQRNSSVNFANMKNLSQKDFESLKKLIKQLQVRVWMKSR